MWIYTAWIWIVGLIHRLTCRNCESVLRAMMTIWHSCPFSWHVNVMVDYSALWQRRSIPLRHGAYQVSAVKYYAILKEAEVSGVTRRFFMGCTHLFSTLGRAELEDSTEHDVTLGLDGESDVCGTWLPASFFSLFLHHIWRSHFFFFLVEIKQWNIETNKTAKSEK